MRQKLPSVTQARFLARLWGSQHSIPVSEGGGYIDPTRRALLKMGWIRPTGSFGTYPSGVRYQQYEINDDGLRALLAFFEKTVP